MSLHIVSGTCERVKYNAGGQIEPKVLSQAKFLHCVLYYVQVLTDQVSIEAVEMWDYIAVVLKYTKYILSVNLTVLVLVQVWLPAVKAKGLEISGTFSRRQGHMYMDMTFTNKALQHMTDFAIQFNKNRSVQELTGKITFRKYSDFYSLLFNLLLNGENVCPSNYSQ